MPRFSRLALPSCCTRLVAIRLPALRRRIWRPKRLSIGRLGSARVNHRCAGWPDGEAAAQPGRRLAATGKTGPDPSANRWRSSGHGAREVQETIAALGQCEPGLPVVTEEPVAAPFGRGDRPGWQGSCCPPKRCATSPSTSHPHRSQPGLYNAGEGGRRRARPGIPGSVVVQICSIGGPKHRLYCFAEVRRHSDTYWACRL